MNRGNTENSRLKAKLDLLGANPHGSRFSIPQTPSAAPRSVSGLHAAYLQVDADRVVLNCNTNMAQKLGSSKGEVLGKPLYEIDTLPWTRGDRRYALPGRNGGNPQSLRQRPETDYRHEGYAERSRCTRCRVRAVREGSAGDWIPGTPGDSRVQPTVLAETAAIAGSGSGNADRGSRRLAFAYCFLCSGPMPFS